MVHADLKIQKDYSLKELNSFAVEAKAKLFSEFSNIHELKQVLSNEDILREKILVLGGGSNLLFTEDFNGLVLKNNIQGIEKVSETESSVELKVGGGVNWDQFVEYCVNANYSGVENLSLIPGTVGASPIQNIGAYGVEVKDVIKSVEVYLISSKSIKTFTNDECKFGYRNSIFKTEFKGKIVVTSVNFNLSKKSVLNLSYAGLANELKDIKNSTIKDVRDTVIKVRRSKLPDEKLIPNAGSFFKNPEIDQNTFNRLENRFADLKYFEFGCGMYKIPAGWMIDKCGLKGARIGKVGTYENQALVIVNYGTYNGNEIKEFSKIIQNKVREKFGINLEPEVNII